MIKSFIKKHLTDPLAIGLDIDDSSTVEKHRQMIASKPLLKKIYQTWYREYAESIESTKNLEGPCIEIGSGAGFSKDIYPEITTTDIAESNHIDEVLDAQHMTHENQSIRGIFLINVAHHLSKPIDFFAEVQRTLRKGGRLVLVEPYNSPFNRMLCTHMDHYEYFDIKDKSWEPAHGTRMSMANMALTWNILVRDQDRFKELFPDLKILRIQPHTFLAYILSGGMSYKSFLPVFLAPLIDCIEWLAQPFMKYLGTTMTIVIEKQ